MKKSLQKALLVFFLAKLICSCQKDTFTTSSSAKLGFSTNSILFDTVFTTVGSITQYFQVYNNNNEAITISSLSLGGGNNSQYRLNVDGIPGKVFSSIIIPKKDSIFVFVAVTVNPTDQNSPLVIRDSILFRTNGNLQKVMLEAWGQDAHYIKGNQTLYLSNSFSINYYIIPCNTTWGLTDNKPYVIYDYAVVDSGCTLTINPGTNVYMHNDAVLWVYTDATLNIQGTASNPVTFQGDNLQSAYKYIPGQWGKIWLSQGSKDNKIEWAIIKNGIVGVEADTTVNDGQPTLSISHCIIKNMTAAALYGLAANINADNCVFADCQQYCGAFIYGGKYTFNQCTFADYWNQSQRTTPALYINNLTSTGEPVSTTTDSVFFGNCIVYGTLSSEFGLDSASTGSFNYKFDHCFLMATGYTPSNTFHNDGVKINVDPQFTNPSIDLYTIGNPIAKTWGNYSILKRYPINLNDQNRLFLSSDTAIGAY